MAQKLGHSLLCLFLRISQVFSNRCRGKDEIQAGRSFLSNRCQDQWQIPWDAQVAPETSAMIIWLYMIIYDHIYIYDYTALMPHHRFTSEMDSPSHLQTANTMWCIQISLPYPGRNVTNHCSRPQQLLPLKPHQNPDPRYPQGWNIQATNRNCDQSMGTGTLVLARCNTRSTTSRVESPGQNPSLDSVLSFKLFHKRNHLSPPCEPPFRGWGLILYYYRGKMLIILHQSCMAELQHRHNNQALKTATVSSQTELLFVDRISGICFSGWPYFPQNTSAVTSYFTSFVAACLHFYFQLSLLRNAFRHIKKNQNQPKQNQQQNKTASVFLQRQFQY